MKNFPANSLTLREASKEYAKHKITLDSIRKAAARGQLATFMRDGRLYTTDGYMKKYLKQRRGYKKKA